MPRKSNARGAQGGGTIRQRPDGRWEARITVGRDPGTGRQIQKSVYGATQKEVRKKLAQLVTEVDSGTYKEPCKMTLGKWLDIWVAEYLTGVKARTADSYKTTVDNHLKPAFGATKLDALAPHEIQRFYNSLQKQADEHPPLSAKTIRNINGVLHKALQQAVELGYIRYNPADACKLPRVEDKEIKPLDSDAIAKFLSVIDGHKFQAVYIVTLFCGLREGEVLGLTWDCIDFDKGSITINKQLQRVRRGNGAHNLVSPKNGKSRRITPAPSVMDVLKRQKQQQSAWQLAAGPAWENSLNLVFTNELGHNLSSQTIYLHFKKLVKEAGYPDTRFHDLRHSYAVAALQSGDDIKTVQETLGHHTAAFTLDVYGHVTEQMKRASADRMEQFIKSVSSL